MIFAEPCLELVASADQHWGIGRDGQLLVHLSEDMRHFKSVTIGGRVIMGRLTALSLPRQKPLPGRENIVLSRDPGFELPGFTVLNGVEDLISYLAAADLAAAMQGERQRKKNYLIGGASLYRQLLPLCYAAHITKFHVTLPADRFLPDLDADAHWRFAASSACYRSQDVEYQFCTYRRISAEETEENE